MLLVVKPKKPDYCFSLCLRASVRDGLTLQHIRKVRPEPPEDHCAGYEYASGDDPEVGGQLVMTLPEPDMVDEALPVPLDYVVDGVELDHVQILYREDLCRPEYRGHPEEELQHHVDYLPHVAEEDDDGRGYPGEPEEQNYGAEQVVEDLDAVERDGRAVNQEHGEDHEYEEGVENERREYLDDREHPDAEVDLLEEKGVFEDRAGGAPEALAEEEPGDDAAEHPENERNISGGPGFEADLEHYPEDCHVYRRVDEGPENAEIGAEVLAAEILFRQLQYHPPALQQIFYK